MSDHLSNKNQIQNGLHTAMAPVGLLRGRQYVSDASTDLDIATYLGHLLHGEVLPTFAEYDDDDAQDALIELADEITEGFSNPDSDQSLGSISDKPLTEWKTYVLPSVLAAWQRGDEAPASVFALAAMAVLGTGQGYDAETVKNSGFIPNNTAELGQSSDGFPGSSATADQLTAWLKNLITKNNLLADQPEAERGALTDRLATQAGEYASDILTEGVKTALKATFQ